jgi:hypothetical protein
VGRIEEDVKEHRGSQRAEEDHMPGRKAVLVLGSVVPKFNLPPPAAPVEKGMTAKGVEPWK